MIFPISTKKTIDDIKFKTDSWQSYNTPSFQGVYDHIFSLSLG